MQPARVVVHEPVDEMQLHVWPVESVARAEKCAGLGEVRRQEARAAESPLEVARNRAKRRPGVMPIEPPVR